MQESIVFSIVRVQCRRKKSSRSLPHLLMSFLLKVHPNSTRRSANIGRKCTLKHVLALVQYPNRCS